MIIPYWLIIEKIFPNYYVPLSIGLVIEILFSAVCLCIPLKLRSKAYLRIPLGIALYFGLAIGIGFLRNFAPNEIWMKILCSHIIYAYACGLLFFLFQERPLPIILVFISLVAIRETADSVDTLIKIGIQSANTSFDYISGAPFIVNALLFDLIHLAVAVPLGLIFYPRRKIHAERRFLINSVTISFGMLFTTIIIKSFMTSHSGESRYLYTCTVILTFLLAILTLLIGGEFIFGSSKSVDLATAEEVLATQQKQFETSKQSIALINAKVHDIKHRIDDLGDKVAETTLQDLKSSIDIYDRPFHTGSQVLDTVLYSKSLVCEAYGIRLSAMGNATSIHKIPSSERFYFFSNILDNAIEATKNIADPEKRIIGLTLEEKDNSFIIESYNYFDGRRKLDNGLIETTKKEKKGHGYGLRSIHDFANRYGGECTIRIEGDMFFIVIRIPLSKIKALK